MPIIFDEVTAEVGNQERSAPVPQEEREPNKSELQAEEQFRRFLRKLHERCARLLAD